jgi:hypothetical protein
MADSTGGEFVAWQSEATINTSYALSMPPDKPTDNQQVVCITDYTADPMTTGWASAILDSLSDQHLYVGNSSNVAETIDTQLLGEIEAKILNFNWTDADITGNDIAETAHGQ